MEASRREIFEGETKCELCETGHYETSRKSDRKRFDDDYVFLYLHKNKLSGQVCTVKYREIINKVKRTFLGNSESEFEINFCPMCGRKIGGEQK